MIPLPAPSQSFDPESRLYARGSGDDKAPILAMLTALDAMQAAGIKPRSNLKFVFEGEEEAGSPNLEKIISANKELFAGDLWLMCDHPVYQTRQLQIVFGARGDTGLDITLYGPRYELHSGHHGNWAPNPAVAPLPALERLSVATAPEIDPMLMRHFWLGSTENTGTKLNELVTQPALNVRGMASSRTGNQASNVIPATAAASLDIRLVPGMDWQETNNRVVEHIRKQGYFMVESEPDAETRRSHEKVALVTVHKGDNAVRTPRDLPIAQEVVRVAKSVGRR